jgi:putative transposase
MDEQEYLSLNQKGCYLTQFQRKLLLKRLQSDLRPEYRRRIQIMLLADAGKSQMQICEVLKCSVETARYWMFMAETGRAHQWEEHPLGRPKIVDDKYQNRLRELVSGSPRNYGYPFERWTGQWLSKHLAKELGIQVSERHINRLLKEMGLSTRLSKRSPEKSQPAENTNITIQDLQISSTSVELWTLNLLQLSTNR